MSDQLILILIILIFLISTLIRSTFGFGNALVAMPLLTLLIGVKEAAPLVALEGFVIALIMVIREWRDLVWKDTLLLLFSSFLGLPLGLLLISAFPDDLVRLILGLLLVTFGFYNLAGVNLPLLERPTLAIPFGFLAGILGGAYNANGPPIVIYGVLRGWDKTAFRASLQGFFFISSLMIVAGHGFSGFWTGEVLWSFLYSLPAVIAAVFLGEQLARKITQEKFNRVIYIFLIVMGVVMFF